MMHSIRYLILSVFFFSYFVIATDDCMVGLPQDMVYVPGEIKHCLAVLRSYDSSLMELSHEISFMEKEKAQLLIDAMRAILDGKEGGLLRDEFITTVDAYQSFINGDITSYSRRREFKVMLDLWVQHALRARSLLIDGNATIQGDLSVEGTTLLNNLYVKGSIINGFNTVNHAVQVGNASGGLTSLPVGTNGQVLIGSTNADPAFANLTSADGSVQFTLGPGSLDIESTPVFGNVVRVDTVFGDDATGERNGLPFKTINAALGAAQSGDAVWIFPGTYAESFTIPSGVSVLGLTVGAVSIAKNVSVATDLVTMGENSRLENVSLSLTSSSHVQLRGIVFPGATSQTAKVRTVSLTVDNSAAGNAGTSNVYGMHSIGTGVPIEQFSTVRASTIGVYSAGMGAKRGVLVDNANDFHMRDTNIIVTNTGTGSAIGIETNDPSAACTMRTGTVSGSTADVSQTQGTLTIATTDLLNSNANGYGFTTTISPSLIIWADIGGLPAGTTFMKVGTSTPNGNETSVRAPQGLIVKTLSVQTLNPPGTTDTFTVRKNGVDTPLVVTLTNPNTSSINSDTSVSFAAGDTISVKAMRGAAGATETVVGMELY